MKLPHRILASAFLLASTPAPLVSASVATSIAEIATRHIVSSAGLDSQQLPTLTHVWVIDVSSGVLPLTMLSALASSVLLGIGLWLIFSKKLPTHIICSATALIGAAAYSIALVVLASTGMGVTLPFVPQYRLLE